MRVPLPGRASPALFRLGLALTQLLAIPCVLAAAWSMVQFPLQYVRVLTLGWDGPAAILASVAVHAAAIMYTLAAMFSVCAYAVARARARDTRKAVQTRSQAQDRIGDQHDRHLEMLHARMAEGRGDR